MNKYFVKRGKKIVDILLDGELIKITIKIPTNRDHDGMMEKFSEVGIDGMLITHGADFIEDRLTKFIIELPFEVPVDNEMSIFKLWSKCSIDEKKVAINCMDSKLRDLINNAISGIENITEDESGN